MKLTEIARIMKLEAYHAGYSTRTLSHGLHIALEPYKQGWRLLMWREDAEPSKQEYKVIAKAFFNQRVKHVSQPDENAIELTTVS